MSVELTRLSIRSLADLTTEVAAIEPEAFTWNDREADAGTADLTVQDDEPTIASLVTEAAVVVSLNNAEAFTILVDALDDDEYAPGEESDQQTVASCSMLRAILSRGRVKPVNGYEQFPYADTRSFSAGILEYDTTGLDFASIIVAAQADKSEFYTGKPSNWCDPFAAWIGPSIGDEHGGYVGHWYVWGDFTLAADTDLVFFMGADNRASVFLDGFSLAEIGTYVGFDETHRATVRASAGDHRIWAKVSNYVDGGGDPPFGLGAFIDGDPTAFICSCFEIDEKGKLGPLVIHTDASWRILEYPDDPPGVSVRQCMSIMLAENDDEGVLSDVTLDGTDLLDSNGNAWDIYEFVTLDIGRSLLDVLIEWSAGYSDFDMPGPTDLTLFMWRWHERGSASGVVFDVDDDPEVNNLDRLHRTDLAKVADAISVRWAGGWLRVPSSGGEKVGHLKLGSTASVEEATRLATLQLALWNAQQTMWSGDVDPTGDGDVPYLNFALGDTVTVSSHLERVTEIRGTLTEGGVVAKVAVRDLILDAQDRLSQTVQRMASGTMGGDAKPASPAAPPPAFGANPKGDETTFSRKDPIEVGEATKDKYPSFSGNLYAVAITLKVGGSTTTELEFLVDGVDVLNGAGIMPVYDAGPPEVGLFVVIPVDYAGQNTVWVEGNSTKQSVNVTAVGTGAAGLLVEPRYL